MINCIILFYLNTMYVFGKRYMSIDGTLCFLYCKALMQYEYMQSYCTDV